MSKTDAYVTVMRLAFLFSPVVLVGWWLDQRGALMRSWRRYQQRRADWCATSADRDQVASHRRRIANDPSPRPLRSLSARR